MKTVLCEFRQESNSFNPIVAGRYSFEMGGICAGQAFLDKIVKEPCAAHGMLDELTKAGCQVIPAYSMVSQSGGPIDQAVVQEFIDHTLPVLRENLPLDAVLVSLHGASQSTQWEDPCGEILKRIRQMVGETTVIAISCDMHANITDEVLACADFVSGYLTYPHTDYYEVGCRAARQAIRRLQGQPVAVKAVRIPMIVAASSYTTLSGPYKQFVDDAKALVADGTLIDFSVFQMQPWLDVSVGGSTVIAAAKEPEIAEKTVWHFAKRLFDLREVFCTELMSMDEVIDIAEKNTDGDPVILVDAADSTNAGAAGDSVAVVEHLLTRKSSLKAAIYLNDGPAVDRAFAIGEGNCAEMTIGCSLDKKYSVSAHGMVKVRRVFADGHYVQEGPAGKGLINNIGAAAVLEMGNITILACHNTAGNGDAGLYRAFGIEPREQQLVVVKACTSYRAAYGLLSHHIYCADTPGAACADLHRLEFVNIPKYFYPFQTNWTQLPLSALSCRGER